MLTGFHLVRDVYCISCHQKLGWAYDCAAEESQRYKEGKVILENAYIENYRGFDDEDSRIALTTPTLPKTRKPPLADQPSCERGPSLSRT